MEHAGGDIFARATLPGDEDRELGLGKSRQHVTRLRENFALPHQMLMEWRSDVIRPGMDLFHGSVHSSPLSSSLG